MGWSLKNQYCFCIQNKFNIVTFPKCGCTQLCKWASECNGYFDEHGHSYSNGKCLVYRTIHRCGKQSMKKYHIREELPTYIIYRFPHERILSYYTCNFHRQGPLSKFVDEVCKRRVWDDAAATPLRTSAHGNWPTDYEHHLGDRFSDVMKYDGATIVHLDDLNNLTDNLAATYGTPTIRGKEIFQTGVKYWDEYKKVEHFNEEMLEIIMKKYSQEYTLEIDI